MKGTKVLYFPDNLDRFGDLFNKYEQHYDFIFFAHGNDKIGKPRYYYLPLAYDPDTHYQRKKDDTIYPLTKKHTVDVAFVGTKHEGRGFLTKVPNITIRGNGWADTIFPVYGALKAKLYSKTKIMINHHVAGDTSPNMRTFECLAMKTFMLSDLVPKTLEAGMVRYKGQSDLEAKIAYYLEHEEEREAIAAKGYELVQPHTYEKRVEALMEVIENARLG
jgi:spore maturation protein CgeB